MREERIVLNGGYVRLVEFWGSDSSIIEAARMSTGKGFMGWGPRCTKCEHAHLPEDGPSCLTPGCDGTETKAGDERLLAYLYNNKHATPFEMAGMVIEVKAPIFVFREWHRHRTQSYNEMSARYVPLPNENYMPLGENIQARIATGGGNKQAGSSSAHIPSDAEVEEWLYQLQNAYDHAESIYQRGLGLGIPKEIARLPVPVARYSRMRASANLRNWLAFLTLRMAPNAQWEIRQYANAVGCLIEAAFPRTWELFAAVQQSPH